MLWYVPRAASACFLEDCSVVKTSSAKHASSGFVQDLVQEQLKMRWFRLRRNGVLEYFADKNMLERKGVLRLGPAATVRRIDSAGGKFGFVVESAEDGALVADAGTDEMASRWVQHLRNVVSEAATEAQLNSPNSAGK